MYCEAMFDAREFFEVKVSRMGTLARGPASGPGVPQFKTARNVTKSFPDGFRNDAMLLP